MRMNTSGLILREQAVGEKDKLITALTKDFGIVRAFVRGAKGVSNRKNSATAQLCYSSLSIYKTQNSAVIDEAQPIEVFFGLRDKIESFTLAQYFSQLALCFAGENEPEQELLRLLLNSLYFLSEGKKPLPQVKAVTELRMMCIAGYMPSLVACEKCGEYETDYMYFDAENGLLYCENCAPSSAVFQLEKGLVRALRHIAFSDFDKIYSFTMPSEALEDLAYITEKYLLSKVQRSFTALDFYKELEN